MMMVRASYLMPDWVAREVVPLVEQFAHLAPSWCHELDVAYGTGGTQDDDLDEDLGAHVAWIEASPEYRAATLHIGGRWFEASERAKRRAIVHEIGHLYIAPLANLTEYMIQNLTDDDSAHQDTLDWQRALAEEAAVEDFAILVCRLEGIE